jgi:hypothetical protein
MMTYQAVETFDRVNARETVRREFLRSERLVFLAGAAAFGAMAGFVAAVAMGRQDISMQWLASTPVLALALLLAVSTLTEAVKTRAYGCSAMAFAHVATLVAWPVLLLFPQAQFWMAPAAALTSVLLLASCWTGSPSAIYRAAGQAALVAALAGYQGLLAVLA